MEEHPIEPYLGSTLDVSYWMYMIHRLVNDKLRKQGNYTGGEDPTFEEVCNKYAGFRATCKEDTLTCSKDPVPKMDSTKWPSWWAKK